MVCLIAAQGMEYSSSYHVELPALVATILQYSQVGSQLYVVA